MIPNWFKVGAKVWFHGFGNPMEVILIDNGEYHLDPEKEKGSWIGKDIDGLHSIPLDEVEHHWQPQHIDFRCDKGK